MFCDPDRETAMSKHRRSRDHKTYCFLKDPINKCTCFINISSAKVSDPIKKTKTDFVEQNATK